MSIINNTNPAVTTISVHWQGVQHDSFNASPYGQQRGGTMRFFRDLLNGTVERPTLQSRPDYRDPSDKVFFIDAQTKAAVQELATSRSASVEDLIRLELFGIKPGPLFDEDLSEWLLLHTMLSGFDSVDAMVHEVMGWGMDRLAEMRDENPFIGDEGVYPEALRPEVLLFIDEERNIHEVPMEPWMREEDPALADLLEARFGADCEEDNLAVLGQESDLSPEMLTAMSRSVRGGIRFGVAVNPNTPSSVLEEMWAREAMFSDYGELGLGMAWNEKAPAHILMQIRESHDNDALSVLAYNPNLPLEGLMALAHSDDELCRDAATEALAQREADGAN